MMRFTITGSFVPYVRMTRRGMWHSPQAQRYLDSQGYLRMHFAQQMGSHGWEQIPKKVPLAVTIQIERKKRLHGTDIDNMAKSCLDAAQGIVYADDRYIDRLQVSRRQTDRDRLELTVTRLEEEEDAIAEHPN